MHTWIITDEFGNSVYEEGYEFDYSLMSACTSLAAYGGHGALDIASEWQDV